MLTIAIANITPQEAAEHFQRAGLSGTAVASIGFGAWGTEPGTRIEFGTESEWSSALLETQRLLWARKEECAYVSGPAHRGLLYAVGTPLPVPA